jgi:hypothetical protein
VTYHIAAGGTGVVIIVIIIPVNEKVIYKNGQNRGGERWHGSSNVHCGDAMMR